MVIFKLFLAWLLNILFPTECLSCGIPGKDLCRKCAESMTPKKRPLPWVISLGNYRDPGTGRVVRHIKNMPNARLAKTIARLFASRIANRPRDPGTWIVIPIPVGTVRRRERGFNQSELLARYIARDFGFQNVNTSLIKSRSTGKQGTAGSRNARRENVKNSFSIRNARHIRGRRIILIDDVVTTGATLSEARDVLLSSGAESVMAWTLAN